MQPVFQSDAFLPDGLFHQGLHLSDHLVQVDFLFGGLGGTKKIPQFPQKRLQALHFSLDNPQFLLGRRVLIQTPLHLAGHAADDHEGVLDFVAHVSGRFPHGGETLRTQQPLMGLQKLLGLQLHLASQALVPEQSQSDQAPADPQHHDEKQTHQEQFLVQHLADAAIDLRHRGHHADPPEVVRRVFHLGYPGD